MRKTKYNNRVVKKNGKSFASTKEYYHYLRLKDDEKHGIITDLKEQVKYELIPAQYTTDENGKRKLLERPCYYLADFVYYNADGKLVVEDVKGGEATKTPIFIIKRKLMLQRYGIHIITT